MGCLNKYKELKEFKNFEIRELPDQDIDNPQADKNGRTIVDGALRTSKDDIYNFKKVFLRKRTNGEYQYFEFETMEVKGISYKFKGKFLEHIVQDVKKGDYTYIRGNLSKYKNGKKIAGAFVALTKFAIL